MPVGTIHLSPIMILFSSGLIPVTKNRMSHGQIQPLSLTNGISTDTSVMSQHFAILVDKITFRQFFACIIFNELPDNCRPIQKQISWLSILLATDRPISPAIRRTSDLSISPHRHQGMRQLMLIQIIQCIRLIFSVKCCLFNRISAIWKMNDSGIVAVAI